MTFLLRDHPKSTYWIELLFDDFVSMIHPLPK